MTPSDPALLGQPGTLVAGIEFHSSADSTFVAGGSPFTVCDLLAGNSEARECGVDQTVEVVIDIQFGELSKLSAQIRGGGGFAGTVGTSYSGTISADVRALWVGTTGFRDSSGNPVSASMCSLSGPEGTPKTGQRGTPQKRP